MDTPTGGAIMDGATDQFAAVSIGSSNAFGSVGSGTSPELISLEAIPPAAPKTATNVPLADSGLFADVEASPRSGHEIPILSNATLAAVSEGIEVPRYPREELKTGWVHIGAGGFAKAHIATILHNYLQTLPPDMREWGMCAISMRDPFDVNNLKDQDGLFTLTPVHTNESIPGVNKPHVIGSIVQCIYAGQSSAVGNRAESGDLQAGPDGTGEALAKLCERDVKVVSMTVTKPGYCLDSSDKKLDLNNPGIQNDLDGLPVSTQTAIGLIVEALRNRRMFGIPAFSLVSCDNTAPAMNGDLLRRAVIDFARQIDPSPEEVAAYKAVSVDFLENDPEIRASILHNLVQRGVVTLEPGDGSPMSWTQERLDREWPASRVAELDDGFCNPPLSQWIEQNVSIPSTMVDRITPRVADSAQLRKEVAQAAGVLDSGAIRSEPFLSFVVENFKGPRPALEAADTMFVEDVTPFTVAKSRFVNTVHVAIAWLGARMGLENVHEVVAALDKPEAPFFTNMMRRDVGGALPRLVREVEAIDPNKIAEDTTLRFINGAIKDQVVRLSTEPMRKMPERVLNCVVDAICGEIQAPVERLLLPVAAWVLSATNRFEQSGKDFFVVGIDQNGGEFRFKEQDKPETRVKYQALIEWRNSLGDRQIVEADVQNLARALPAVFGESLPREARFLEGFAQALNSLRSGTVQEATRAIELESNAIPVALNWPNSRLGMPQLNSFIDGDAGTAH